MSSPYRANELRVVSRQHAARDYVEHKIVGDAVFALGERPIRSAQYSDDLGARKHPSPEIRRQHVTQPRAPQNGRVPFRIFFTDRLGDLRILATYPTVMDRIQAHPESVALSDEVVANCANRYQRPRRGMYRPEDPPSLT